MANKADKAWYESQGPQWMQDMTKGLTGAIFGREAADEILAGEADLGTIGTAVTSQVKRVGGFFAGGGLATAGAVLDDIGYESQMGKDLSSVVPSAAATPANTVGVVFDAFEDANTIFNTGVSSGVLLTQGAAQAAIINGLGLKGTGVNPVFDDGFQVDDVRDTWDKVWEGKVTPGRAVSHTFGRNAMNAADWVTGGRTQKAINDWIIEQNEKALNDPKNTRGLLSWASGLHSEFNIYDKYQGDSAYNQGAGRWISGGADAAVMWWASFDVLLAKGGALVGRHLLTKSIDSLADVSKATTELAQHRAFQQGLPEVVVNGQTFKAKETSIGRLSDSLVKVTDETVAAEHDFARLSSNKTLVARVITEADTPEKMDLGIRAMLGDTTALREVRGQFSASVEDALSLQSERNARVAEYLRLMNEGPDVVPNRAAALRQQADEVDRLNKVLEEERLRQAELDDLLSAEKGASQTTGISAVRFGTQNKKSAIRLARGKYGVNTPQRLVMKAEKAANRKQGKLFTERNFTTLGGRPIRVIRSAVDYVQTYRAVGRVNVAWNSDELYDEIASIFTTNPVFRRMQKVAPDQRELAAVDNLGQVTAGRINVDALREKWLARAVQARNATERIEVIQAFQNEMLAVLRAEYGISASKARKIFNDYKARRKDIDENVEAYGWFKDGDEIVAVPDLQSQMGETIEIMDFNFLETIFRLSEGGAASQSIRLKGGAGTTKGPGEVSQQFRSSFDQGVIAKLDAIWRPLVLMRLGYTQRNVMEGMLRELAAYGSLGILMDRDAAVKLDPGMTWAEKVGYRTNQFSNAFTPAMLPWSYKAKVKKLSASISKQQQILQSTVGEIRAAEMLRDKAVATQQRLAGNARSQAEKNLTKQAKKKARAHASATVESTEDLSLGQITEMMDNATDIYIPAQYVRPLYQTAGGRNSKSVSGFEDELDAQLQPVAQGQGGQLDTLDQYMGMNEVNYASMSKWLPESSRERLRVVMYSEPGTPEYEDYLDLLVDASFSAMSHAERKGFAVVRVRGDGRYDVIQSRDEVMIDDLENGNIAVIPKDNFGEVKFIRAKVYGDVLDLRYMADDPAAPGGDPYSSVDDITDAMWVDATEFGLDESLSEELTEYAVDVLTNNPDLIRAVNLGRAIMRMKNSHPEIYELAEKKGLLSYSKEFKKAIDRARKAKGTKAERLAEWETERDAFLERMDDPEFLETLPELEDWVVGEGGELTFHGGKIKDDIVTEPPVTKQSVTNYHGSAYLYATAAQWMGAEYILVKSFKEGVDEPKLYMVDHPYEPDNFIDMDGLFIDPETGIPNPDVEKDAARWLDSVLQESEFDEPFEDVMNEVTYIMRDAEDRAAFNENRDPEPLGLKHWRRGMESWITQKRLSSPDDVYPPDPSVEDIYAAQELIREGALAMGAAGLRHKGGKNHPSVVKGETEHDVYVYYVEPEVAPIESLTPELMRLKTIYAKQREAEMASLGRSGVADFYRRFAPYNVDKWDASDMTPRTMDIISDLATEAGYGSVIATDSLAPSGRRVITRPDQMSFGADQNIDEVIPGGMLQRDYIDRVFPELQHQNMLANASVYRGKDRDSLMAWIGNKEAVRFITRGGDIKKLSPQARASIARAMEGGPNGMNRYSHITVGGDEKIYSASQIMGGKKFGAAYGAMLDKSDVEQETARLLRNSEDFQVAKGEAEELEKQVKGITDQFQEQQDALRQTSELLRNLTFKRNRRKTPNRGFGKEKFTVAGVSEEFEVEGPFMDTLYASMASSELRNNLMLFGLADIHWRELQRGSQQFKFKPGHEYYFMKVSEQMNKLYRRDPLAEMLLKRPELRDDNVFAESLPEIIDGLSKTQRGRAWLRDQGGVEEFKGLVDRDILSDAAFDNAYEAADRIRVQLMDILPDDDALWKMIGDNDVSATQLMSEAGWRDDWGNILDYEMIYRNEGWYRKTVGKVMRTLGTVPEDHLIRHPFFRARWREDMQRQMDLYMGQKRRDNPDAEEFFTQDEINQMNLVARQYALKATNETLFTIQRLSTPAHMMKFISPFFPAWASTMRFWGVRMPLQKPENIVRYGMVFDAPASAGMMQDREGNQVEGGGLGTAGMISKLFSDDDNMIVIQTTGKSAEWLSKITGGQTRLGVSRGSLDMMLQGDTFWLPGFGPMLTLPIGALAQMNPSTAEGFKNAWNRGPMWVKALTKAVYDSALPMGPSKEKSPTDMAIEAFAPGMAANFIKRIRGTDSASFSNTAQSIYRDDINAWELSGRQGPKPEFEDAVNKAQGFYLWRVVFSGTLPFAPAFSSENTFYVNEWRAIEQETYDNGGNYTDAMDTFIGRYGPEFFAYTQSLSGGSSGVSAKAGEFEEVTGNMELYGDLANIGEDASYMTMASRGVADWSYNADGFDPAVYAWQFNRSIEGAPGKFFRSGSNQRSDMLQDIDRQAGWYYYDKMLAPYKELYENEEIDQATYSLIKGEVVAQIGTQYPTWFEVYGQNSNERYVQSAKALRRILTDDKWMSQHGDTEYAQALVTFQTWRDSIIQELIRRDRAGGSDSIDAKSNEDLALMYEALVQEVGAMDSSGEAARAIDRFFGENDALVPIPGVDY